MKLSLDQALAIVYRRHVTGRRLPNTGTFPHNLVQRVAVLVRTNTLPHRPLF